MMKMIFKELAQNPGITPVGQIPELGYKEFRSQTIELLGKESCHCLNYFTLSYENHKKFIILIGNDDSHKIYVYSHIQASDVKSLDSITSDCFPLHIFEREISERTGICFEGHPWLKPVRYPFDRKNRNSVIADYPFYSITSEETHEVGVGPVHAGIIEPGHFRFHCYGEKVLHLEIQLGYQHRGVEPLFLNRESLPERSVIAESIAGDTAIGHSLAFAQLIESLAGVEVSENLEAERIIALELERIAVHIGDTAALCGDVAYQLGQVACEALRTLVINTMQDWCGNRFGKGLIRPGGTRYPLDKKLRILIIKRLEEVGRRFSEVTDMIFNDSGVVARFENIGTVSSRQAFFAGAVGMAARTSGIGRDIRRSHPFQVYRRFDYKPAILHQGDVFARAFLRKMEVEQSCSVINELVTAYDQSAVNQLTEPDYTLKSLPGVLCVSLTEAWRGEVCHIAVTGDDGKILEYKIKDPSLHNWHVLAVAVRDQEISDFPVCNKSFNLAYCGNDL